MSGTSLLSDVADGFFNPEDTNADWPERRMKVQLWSKQRAIRESVRINRFTAVPSCHGVGKSFIAALCSCEWIDTHKLGEAFVVSTAPTAPQVNAILWREIERMHREADLPGHIAMGRIPEWKIGRALVGYGRKPSDYDESGFQGIHEEYLLIVIDEADGIPAQLWEAIRSLASNINARVLAIGNPNDPKSHFKVICQPGSGWNVIHLDGLYSPNFTEDEVRAASCRTADQGGITGNLYQYMVDNGIPFATEKVPFRLQTRLLSPLYAAECMISYGIYKLDDGTWTTSPLWDAKVRGRFSDQTTDGVIPHGWIMRAVNRWKEWQDSGRPVEALTGQRVWAVDPAGEGSDDTCVAERIGYICLGVERNGWGQDTQTPAKVLSARAANTKGHFIVDTNGMGQGVTDRLRENGFEVISFVAQETADMTDSAGEYSFPNVRSAAWWNLREILNPDNGLPIMLPDDEFLIADLAAPKYEIRTGAKIHVEDKKITKRRLRRSPDTGDAVVMVFWLSGFHSGAAFTLQYGASSEFVASYDGDSSSIGNAHVVGHSVFDDVFDSYATGWGR